MQNLQTMKQSVQKGFTLIELMIVVAIIGILAALAIPAYTDYTIKSRVAEGASLSGAIKTAIEVYWSENGTLVAPGGGNLRMLTDLEIDTLPSARYVSEVTVGAGPVINVFLRSGTSKLGDAAAAGGAGGADGGCFVYSPERAGNLVWSVVATSTGCTLDIPQKYRPKQ